MNLASLIAGKPVSGTARLTIRNPYNGLEVGTVAMATRRDVDLP